MAFGNMNQKSELCTPWLSNYISGIYDKKVIKSVHTDLFKIINILWDNDNLRKHP